MRKVWLFPVLLVCGCPSLPLDDHVGDDLFVGDDANINGNVNVDGEVNAPNGGNFGGVIFPGDGNVILPPGGEVIDDDDEPEMLFATISSASGATTFNVGQNAQMVVNTIGGVGPLDLYCQWPDADFTTINDSTPSSFQFKRTKKVISLIADFENLEKKYPGRAKVISIPGTGVLSCRVTDASGQEANVWLTITVQ
ncbi:MAG: hypothetical protein AAB455_00860 [Patescibacteria group bacterium]